MRTIWELPGIVDRALDREGELSGRIDDLARDQRRTENAIDDINAELERRPTESDVESDLGKLEDRIAGLEDDDFERRIGALEEAVEDAAGIGERIESLELLVEELHGRIELLRGPGAGPGSR